MNKFLEHNRQRFDAIYRSLQGQPWFLEDVATIQTFAAIHQAMQSAYRVDEQLAAFAYLEQTLSNLLASTDGVGDAIEAIKDAKKSIADSMPRAALDRWQRVFELPPKVDSRDLQSNGKLLTEAEIQKLQEASKGKRNFRWGKKAKKSQYGAYAVTKMDGRLYAIYKGAQQDRHLGAGGFGKVKLMQDLQSGAWAAMKVVLNVDAVHPEIFKDEYQPEIDNLKMVGQLKGSVINTDNDKVFMGMLLAAGVDMMKLKEQVDGGQKVISPSKKIDVANSALEQLAKLHAKGMVHQDIKDLNVMVSSQNAQVSIVDYGAGGVGQWQEKEGRLVRKGYDLLGTQGFVAPELVQAKSKGQSIPYSNKSDVYAMGITLGRWLGFVADLSAQFQDAGSAEKKVLKQRMRGNASSYRFQLRPIEDVRQTSGFEPEVLAALYQLITAMTVDDPMKRLSAKDARQQLAQIQVVSVDKLMNNVAFVKAQDLILDTGEVNPDVLHQLKSFDSVWLIEDLNHLLADRDDVDLKGVLNTIAKAGVVIQDIVTSVEEDFDTALLEITQHVESVSQTIDTYFWVTGAIGPLKPIEVPGEPRMGKTLHTLTGEAAIPAQIEKAHESDVLSVAEFDRLMQGLVATHMRNVESLSALPQKSPAKEKETIQHRIDKIQVTKSDLTARHTGAGLTRAEAVTQLNTLRKHMTHVTSGLKFLGTRGLFKSESSSEIKAIVTDLEHGPKPK